MHSVSTPARRLISCLLTAACFWPSPLFAQNNPTIKITKNASVSVSLNTQNPTREVWLRRSDNQKLQEVDVIYTLTGSPPPGCRLTTTSTNAPVPGEEQTTGNGSWRLRFGKKNIGTHEYTLKDRDSAASDTFSITVTWKAVPPHIHRVNLRNPTRCDICGAAVTPAQARADLRVPTSR